MDNSINLTATLPQELQDTLSRILDKQEQLEKAQEDILALLAHKKRLEQAKQMLTVSDVAELLGISEDAVRRLCYDRKITFTQAGSNKYFFPEDVKAYMTADLRPSTADLARDPQKYMAGLIKTR